MVPAWHLTYSNLFLPVLIVVSEHLLTPFNLDVQRLFINLTLFEYHQIKDFYGTFLSHPKGEKKHKF